MKKIVVRGAREHNLQNLDVEIPREKLVVITGLSGSGKSSLAFDTIYAEGQRRYVESLSAYARQFLNQNQKPDVDGIDGLSPAISIEQKSTSRNPRSTVGTLTEIYDYLRLLFARVGSPHCSGCGKSISAQTVQQIVDSILRLPEGTKYLVLAPVVRGRKGEYRKELKQWRKQGFVRVRIDGQMRLLEEDIVLDKNHKHTIELVVDRLVSKSGLKKRLTDSVELALKEGEGLITTAIVGGDERTYSENFACHECGLSFPEIEPRLFSFNSPYGACAECDGLGHGLEMDPEKIVPDPSKSLREGAIKPWTGRMTGYYRQQLLTVAQEYGQSADIAWNKLPARLKNVLLHGSGKREFEFVYESDGAYYTFERPFEGVVPQLKRRFKESQSDKVREKLHRYMSIRPCRTCQGARLQPFSLSILIKKRNINALCSMSIAQVHEFFAGLKLNKKQSQIAKEILKEIDERLSFLLAVGLDYLSLDRSSATLSGGEAQRIRLATQIGSALQGVIYVLDEPSIGLHQRDNQRLLETLQRLRDLGNTVLVVEHDLDTILAADHIIDLGPGAGVHGGEIVAQGSIKQVSRVKASLTAAYLTGTRRIALPERRRGGNGTMISLEGASGNNLRGVNVEFPLGKFICVCGVSGSGKSTLVNDTLYKALAANVNKSDVVASPYKGVTGLEQIDKVIDIDQSPIGRTPRSNPATYTQLFGPVRELFAQLPESKARGYKPGRFSFNVKGGRCEACEGDGVLKIEMHFLPDVYVTCEQCNGARYNRETLEICFKGKNIADVLRMSIEEAADFFAKIPTIKRKLDTLLDVGLGYIQLGQSATTLSGGEAQRVKLSRELSKRSTGKTFYILDEPTTGLHFFDVEQLLKVLHRFVDGGNTVVVIEHNLDVIKTADHIIDLGPEGGSKGGEIVATGTPEDVAQVSSSFTGQFLKPLLNEN